MLTQKKVEVMIDSGMKYIVFEVNGIKRPVIFDRSTKHSEMASMVFGEPISAGFLTSGLECFGHSHSLGLESVEGDTKLIRDKFKSPSQLMIERMDSEEENKNQRGEDYGA